VTDSLGNHEIASLVKEVKENLARTRPRTPVGTWVAIVSICVTGLGSSGYVGTRVSVLETKFENLTEVFRKMGEKLEVAVDIPAEQRRTEDIIRRMVKPEALR
jgi:hypothetical protein